MGDSGGGEAKYLYVFTCDEHGQLETWATTKKLERKQIFNCKYGGRGKYGRVLVVKITDELLRAIFLNFENTGFTQDKCKRISEFIKEWVKDGNDTEIMGD